MRFAAEAAGRGLWREAAFRWEKVLKDDPQNARVHNNLAVACESLGQFERARKEYEEARRLAPDSKEIRTNYEAFLEFCKQSRSCGAGPEKAGAPAGAAASPSPTPGGDSPLPAGSPGAPPSGG